MATVNFSVPDDVKEAFDRRFRDRNKSAIIAELMRRAVAEADREQRRAELFRHLTEERDERPTVSDAAIREARDSGRR